MIVVAQCLRHRIVDGKGAGPIDQLRSSSRIARTSSSRLRVNERSRLGGGPNTKLGRCVGISHDAQQEIERGYSRVRGSGVDRCIHECCLLVWRTTLAPAAPFAWFRSSWHCCFPKALLGPIEPVTRHTPLPGRRGPKPQPEAHRRQCAGRLSRAPGE